LLALTPPDLAACRRHAPLPVHARPPDARCCHRLPARPAPPQRMTTIAAIVCSSSPFLRAIDAHILPPPPCYGRNTPLMLMPTPPHARVAERRA